MLPHLTLLTCNYSKLHFILESAGDIIDFFSQQASAIKANLAGVDGNGALVFGRDWAYPGPDTDSNVIL